MRFLINLLIGAIAVAVSAYILPGVSVDSFWIAIIVAIVLGVINALLKPLLLILTLPINVVTLGLFTLVINALLILLADGIVPGFDVDGFWWALLFSLVLAVVNAFFATVKD